MLVTLMILWTAFGSVFALLLGYSRIPYAAATQGDFFRPFAHVHPTKKFPDVSLYVLGAVSIVASFFTLDQVITALITTRVIVQFGGQIVAVPLLRKGCRTARPYKMWLYPVPAVVAFVGWAYIFVTSGWGYVAVGLLTLAAGVGAFLVRSRLERTWPFAAAVLAALVVALPAGAADNREQPLRTGWAIQSSAKVADKGDVLSKPGYDTREWAAATVPSTVVGALVANGTYPDPYFGMNLRSIPGTTYPIGERFALIPTPGDSPFKPSWWYRTEFKVPLSRLGRSFFLHFDGINYRANVWLNGERLAAADEVAGTFRRFELDATRLVRIGEPNALAVEVIAPEPHDLAIMWVDWNPTPADKNMGLWGSVYLTDTGPLALRNPHVVSRLPLPALRPAELTVTAEVWNVTDKPVSGIVRGRIESILFKKEVTLAAGSTPPCASRPRRCRTKVEKARIWGVPLRGPGALHAHPQADVKGVVSDRQDEVRHPADRLRADRQGHRRSR